MASGSIQALLGCQLEENLVIGGAAQPDVVGQFLVQLAGFATGVAQGDEDILGAAAAAHVQENIPRGGQLQWAEIQARLPLLWAAMQYEAALGLYRAAVEHHPIADGPGHAQLRCGLLQHIRSEERRVGTEWRSY